MTATTAPRLRVDNAFYVYRHDGTLIAQQPLQELLEAQWLPAPSGASFAASPWPLFPSLPHHSSADSARITQQPLTELLEALWLHPPGGAPRTP